MRLISNGQWDDLKPVNRVDPNTLKIFANIHSELTSVDGKLVLRGNRIVIPDVLQKRVVELGHEGHQGWTLLLIQIVHSTAAKAVIPKLDRIFAAYGIPKVVKSNNGPPFNGHEFAQFANYLGFKHRKVTPLWPEANGEVERFMINDCELETRDVPVLKELSCHNSLHYWYCSSYGSIWTAH